MPPHACELHKPANVPPASAQATMGHSSLRQTVEYTHALPGYLAEAVERLDKYLGTPVPVQALAASEASPLRGSG